MWVDVEGVCHTVALPEPAELMSLEFRASLDRLIDAQAEEVSDVLSSLEDEFYAEQLERPSAHVDEQSFVGTPPPAGLLRDAVASVDELVARILEVDRRWRLDVLVALDDYLP